MSDTNHHKVCRLPTAANAPIKNPRTRGPKKGTASFMVAKRRRDAAQPAMAEEQSPYMPESVERVPEVIAGKFNYPTLLLWQRYFSLGGTGARYLPTLNASMLVNEKFISPLGSLLKQLIAEGHDVQGALLEYEALRESTGKFADLHTQIQKVAQIGISDVSLKNLREQ